MIRKSGVRPAVKRWKLSWLTPRRAASGHIAATQLGKFAAAWRIALAVISGWPEAPSSPLQGGGTPSGPGVACGCPGVADFDPEKMLPNRSDSPLPDDCARAWPDTNKAAAKMIVPVRLVIEVPVDCILCACPKRPFQKASPRF